MEENEHFEQCTQPSIKQKFAELLRAIQGFFEDHHRFQLKMMMHAIEHLESEIKVIKKRLDQILIPNQDLMEQLDEVPVLIKRWLSRSLGISATH